MRLLFAILVVLLLSSDSHAILSLSGEGTVVKNSVLAGGIVWQPTATGSILNVTIPQNGLLVGNDLTLKNSIVLSIGDDISIDSEKTVTGTSNLFGDSGKMGSGTYTDVAGTLWSSNPLLTSNFSIYVNSPAINAGVDICDTLVDSTDMGGTIVCTGGSYVGGGANPYIGAYNAAVSNRTSGAPMGMGMGMRRMRHHIDKEYEL